MRSDDLAFAAVLIVVLLIIFGLDRWLTNRNNKRKNH